VPRPSRTFRGAPPSAERPPAEDVHPVLRRASAPPAALDLLAQAQHGLDEAVTLQTANERYATAHLAALRTAAAVLAVRGRPEPTARRRRAIRSAWEVLPEAAPELAEWSALFASGAGRRGRAEAGIKGAVSWREADDLVRETGVFLRLVERMLVTQPALPQPRLAPADEKPAPGGGPAAAGRTARSAPTASPSAAPIPRQPSRIPPRHGQGERRLPPAG
jgi:hypothetical protein